VLSTSERMQPTLPGVEETATESSGVVEADTVGPVATTLFDSGSPGEAAPPTGAVAPAPPASAGPVGDTPAPASPADQLMARAEPRDAPYCYQCGNAMQRAGSCYVCGSCGTTSGCS